MARRLSYRALHWGTEATGTETVHALGSAPCKVVGSLVSIAYTTQKRRAGVWEHEFEPQGGRLPLLLAYDGEGGPVMAGPVPKTATAIGWCLDVVVREGRRTRRIVTALAWVMTDQSGSRVLLGSRAPLYAQIEDRQELGPYVTAHGIEG